MLSYVSVAVADWIPEEGTEIHKPTNSINLISCIATQDQLPARLHDAFRPLRLPTELTALKGDLRRTQEGQGKSQGQRSRGEIGSKVVGVRSAEWSELVRWASEQFEPAVENTQPRRTEYYDDDNNV